MTGSGRGGTAVAQIDAVLCSTATRTRQTLERTGITAPVQYVDRIYDSTPGIVIDEINGACSRFAGDIGDHGNLATLLVVGHEPVMSSLAVSIWRTAQTCNGAVARGDLNEVSYLFDRDPAHHRAVGPTDIAPAVPSWSAFHIAR